MAKAGTSNHSPCPYQQPNKMDFYITLRWKGLPGTNTLAFWARW
jgi:hypothetical protein